MLRSSHARLACLAAVAGVCIYAAASATSQRVTTYAVTCLVAVRNGTCASPGQTLDPATFIVSVQQQTVWVSGTDAALTGCVVRSTSDWRCKTRDDESEFGVTEGRPWLGPRDGRASDLYFVSRWRYLWMRAGERRRTGPLPALFR